MSDFNVRSDSVNVEQIMEQIRARIREKRGVDYTEQQIRELAAVKLEKFLDPRGVRSDLLNEFRRGEPDPNYAFEDDTIVPFHAWRRLSSFAGCCAPVLKLFFNPNPLIHVLHMQSQINDLNASRHQLYYELIHNLVVETTRLGIEVKNLKMRVESLDARVDFSERRARALEGAVMYRPQVEDERGGAPAGRRSRHRSGAPARTCFRRSSRAGRLLAVPRRQVARDLARARKAPVSAASVVDADAVGAAVSPRRRHHGLACRLVPGDDSARTVRAASGAGRARDRRSRAIVGCRRFER